MPARDLSVPEDMETKRLRLRRARTRDAPMLFRAYSSDPEVTRYLTWDTHGSVDDMRAFLERAHDAWESGSEFVWVIEERSGGAAVGTISVRPVGRRAGIGYVLARDRWNRGYMTEALTHLIAWLSAQEGIARIEALCDVDNLASQKVMEKAGMTREALLRRRMVLPNLSPKPRDMYLYSVRS